MARALRTMLACGAAAALGCATGAPRGVAPPEGLDDGAARATLARFAGDLERGRFEDAHRLLSARWREAYTPGRLALDFRGGGPPARDAAARALAAAAAAPLERDGDRARIPVGEGRAAVLVAERGAWRVDALE